MPLTIIRDDITRLHVDAIVNPANSSLAPGGGCCGAIHRAAGRRLARACAEIGRCETGNAVITPGYDLPAKYVVHTVGPVWNGGTSGEPALLAACYAKSLRLAAQSGCTSIAFPLISSGIFGYPKREALTVARDAITAYLLNEDTSDMQVYLAVFEREALIAGNSLFDSIRIRIDDTYEGLRRFESEKRFRSPSMNSAPMAVSTASFSVDFDAPICEDLSVEQNADLDDLLRRRDESFSEMLLRLIDERGMSDAECYKLANKDRKLFNKIKLNPSYHPGKTTALSFAIALRLDIDKTEDLIGKAGFALTNSSKGDIIVKYCIEHGQYNIMAINEILFAYDQELL